MARLRFPVPNAGAVAEPAGVLKIDVSSGFNLSSHPGLPVSSCLLPGERGVVYGNGYDKLRHIIDATGYDTGGLAPSAAPTVTPTGVQATATLDLDVTDSGSSIYTPADGEEIVLQVAKEIKFVTTLGSPAASDINVKIDGSGTAALGNLVDLMNNVNEGISWEVDSAAEYALQVLRDRIEIASSNTYSITFRRKEYGTVGNASLACLWSGIWTDCDFGSQGATVGTLGYLEGGTDGSGSYPEEGKYRYIQTNFRSVDGAETGASPVATANQGTAQNISVDALSANDDTSFDFVRVYRTEDTGAEFFPVDDVARALAASPDFTDNVANGEDDGSLQGLGVVPFDEGLYLDYRGGFPPRPRCLALWKNRVWGGGACLAADYSAGTANVGASDTVTLSTGAVPMESMVGNTFSVDGDAETYTILKVVESTRVITLDRDYEGSVDATADYTIKDDRDPSQIWCSEPGLQNQWPTKNNPGSVDQDGDDEGITGMVAMDDALVVFSRTTMYRVTGDDEFSWQVHRVSGGVGCLAQATIQKVRVAGQSGIIWLSPDGVFFYGGGSPLDLSLNDSERGISDTLERINPQHAHLSHSYYSQTERVWRCFVPLDDDVVPSHAIVYDLLRRDFAGPDETPPYTHSGVIVNAAGERVVVAGDRFGGLWQLETGTSDGGYGSFEPVQALESGCTVRTLTRKTGTDWPTTGEGLDGVPCLVLYADGSYAYRTIVSNTDNDLTLDRDLDTAPAENDQVIVGSIHAIAESGRGYVSDLSMEAARWRKFILLHSPEDDGEAHVSFAGDQEALALPDDENNDSQVADLTDESGRSTWTVGKRKMQGKFSISVIEPGCTGSFLGYGLELEQRAK